MATAAPKLLFSTAPFFRHPLREAFRHISAAGYDTVEVMVTSDPATQDARRIRELADDFGLSVAALHAPFLLLTRRVWGTDPIAKIYRATQVAEQAEIPLIVIHPPYRWQVKFRRWVAESLTEYAARAGVTIAVENMFPLKIRGDRGLRFHVSQKDVEDLDRFTHLVLDTSHLAVAGIGLLDAYERYKTKVVHFHLSDNAGKGWDSHLPLGDERGTLPLQDLLDAVAGDGFAGNMSLELDLRPYIEDRGAIADVLARQRELAEDLLRVRA
jgi:sugar phosphate isomerase/epimerase